MDPEPRYCYRHPDRETGLSCSECGRPICWECMTPAAVGLRCPEHSGKPQGIHKVTAAAERAATGAGARQAYLVTNLLIGACVLVYVCELAIQKSQSVTQNWIYDHGALVANGFYVNGILASCPPSTFALIHGASYYCFATPQSGGQAMIGVAHGQWWRLLTSAFLHEGFLHIALNMASLFFCGRILEVVIGRWRYLLLYLASAFAGSAGALLVTPNSPSLGASGAIFGVLGALLVLEQRGTIHTGGQIFGLIVLNLVLSFAIPGISYGAHIGGLIAGLVLMFAYARFRSSPQLSLVAAAAVIAVSVALAYAVI